MTDSGLNQRLRQRSRRSGLMIGVSMALTLMLCVAAFTMIYARLEPVVSDFVGQGDIEIPTKVPTEVPPTEAPVAAAPTEEPAAETQPTTAAQASETEPANPDDFTPDYQTAAGRPVNLRPGPGVDSGDAIVAVPDASPIMFLDEEEATTDPERDEMESGQVWMKFRTEDGEEGWIREIDVETYQP